jgi:exodeoxyribonuclease-5
MLNRYIYNEIIKAFEYEPTSGQELLIQKLSEFVSASSDPNEIFLLKGYAGTGKTSTVAALVQALKNIKQQTFLAAPTGRAAKVLSAYANSSAFTIHKKIYRQQSTADGIGKFVMDINQHKNTIFIVDEASMIANGSNDNSIFGSGRLLDDLIEYVYNDKGCKLILIGDIAQLPPVKLDISPALDTKELETYGKKILEHELTEVVRQNESSGILYNATKIRSILQKSIDTNAEVKFKGFPKFKIQGFIDIKKVNGADLIESISDAYGSYSEHEVVVICRSNKRANSFNQGIRASVLYREEEISIGDLIMIVKNNYFWAEEYEEIDFIANGDTAEIVRIKKYTERYGFRFADVTLKFYDYKNIEMDAKILLDTLNSENASLSYDQNVKLYRNIEEDYIDIKNKRKRYEKIREHPFFNALQVKFAYAVTCHKAQGGQWKIVYVDQGWVREDMIDKEYLRWLYTAFTRSETELALVNFRKDFFYENEIFD